MFSHPHETVTDAASRRFGETAAYTLLGVIVVLLVIAMFINPALPKGWFFGLL